MNRKYQDDLLAYAINSGEKLDSLLSGQGLSYDDLRYEDSFDRKNVVYPQLPVLDDLDVPGEIIPAVSFFSGGGGLNVGFSYAGFNNIISIEHTEQFCNTLRANFPAKLVVGPPDFAGDISDRTRIAAILHDNGVTHGFNGVFHGGPPCQSFSIAANQRYSKEGENFKRTGFADEEKGTLIFDYIWYIREFRPLAFLIENVAGIEECDEDGALDAELNRLRCLGYRIPAPIVVDAAFYGVPQHRRRWIAMGTRGARDIGYPIPDKNPMPCGSVFEIPLANVPNHLTRKHKAESVARYARLAAGGRDHLGRVDRLDPSKPSKTVIAGGVKGGGRSHLHPFIPRTISVRECARLQTFPDDYVFTGSTARQFTQVGNAVPPMLAYRFAMAIRNAIIADFRANQVYSL